MYHYSLQNNVSADTPPTFLALSTGDNIVPPENSFLYYDALVAHNVPAQIYVYPYGGHGWGFTTPEFGKDNLGAWRPVFSSLSRFGSMKFQQSDFPLLLNRCSFFAKRTRTLRIEPKLVLLSDN